VQAVLDGEVFEIAQPGIDAAQRFVGRNVVATPASRARLVRCAVSTISFASRSRRRRSRPSAWAYSSTRRSSVERVAGQFGRRDQRRRQMADGHARQCGAWPAPPRPDC
jgi:hypothetical protein